MVQKNPSGSGSRRVRCGPLRPDQLDELRDLLSDYDAIRGSCCEPWQEPGRLYAEQESGKRLVSIATDGNTDTIVGMGSSQLMAVFPFRQVVLEGMVNFRRALNPSEETSGLLPFVKVVATDLICHELDRSNGAPIVVLFAQASDNESRLTELPTVSQLGRVLEKVPGARSYFGSDLHEVGQVTHREDPVDQYSCDFVDDLAAMVYPIGQEESGLALDFCKQCFDQERKTKPEHIPSTMPPGTPFGGEAVLGLAFENWAMHYMTERDIEVAIHQGRALGVYSSTQNKALGGIALLAPGVPTIRSAYVPMQVAQWFVPFVRVGHPRIQNDRHQVPNEAEYLHFVSCLRNYARSNGRGLFMTCPSNSLMVRVLDRLDMKIDRHHIDRVFSAIVKPSDVRGRTREATALARPSGCSPTLSSIPVINSPSKPGRSEEFANMFRGAGGC